MAAASAAVTLLSYLFQGISIQSMFFSLGESHYFIFLLNMLPIFLVMLALYFVSNNPMISIGPVSFFVLFISVANRTKVRMRQYPLTLSDVTLVRELVAVSQDMSGKIVFVLCAIVVILIIAVAFATYIVKTKKIKIPVRIAGGIVCLLAIAALNGTVYSDAGLYSSFYVEGAVENSINHYYSKGLVYSLMFNYNSTKISQPENYDAKALTEFQTGVGGLLPRAEAQGVKPDIIVIMGEAFSDISNNEAFDFTGYTDPLKYFNELKKDALSGYIIAPSFGGGTAETEFDFITGINSRFFRTGYHIYTNVNKNIDSTAWRLRELGYYTEFLHPGESWFYGRMNAVRYLGFEKFLSVWDFDHSNRKGPYVSEQETMRFFIENYETYKNNNPDRPYYGFLTTIQNHGPYGGKYSEQAGFKLPFDLNGTETDNLSNY
jgi:phosphoglycerol transferase MdoB-like AlkP superfamily enzyme